jgi:cell wall assembly regulator SMI1
MTFNESNSPPATDEEVIAFEKEAGIALPQDYRQFLLTHNGGKPSLDLLTIPDCEQEALIDHFLGLSRPHEDLRNWVFELKDDIPRQCFKTSDWPNN